MTDPLSSDDAEIGQGTKENFVGKVVRTAMDADDDMLSDEYESDIDILYEIQPFTEYDKRMYEMGVDVRSGLNSKWVVFIGHLENIHGDLSEHDLADAEDVLDFMTGRVYEFTDLAFKDGEEFHFEESGKTLDLGEVGGDDNQANPMMLPVREVTDEDELQELAESQDDDDVEQISL